MGIINIIEKINNQEKLQLEILNKSKNFNIGIINQIDKIANEFKMKGYSIEIEKLICYDYLENNLTNVQIANKYNVSKGTITNIVRKYNLILKHPREYKKLAPIDEKYFETIDTQDKAYFLGFITGDGCLKHKETSISLCISLTAPDVEILEKFKYYLNSQHKISKSKPTERVFNGKLIKTGELVSLAITNTKLCKLLPKHGITYEKSNKISLPTTIPDELMCHYIRGLLDSDGCWRISNNHLEFSICSSVENFIIELQEYLMQKLNLNKTKIHPNSNTNKCFSVVYNGNFQTKRIYDYLYKSGGPWLTRKFKKSTEHFLKIDLLKESDIPKENLPFELQNFIKIEKQEEKFEEKQLESPKKCSILNLLNK